MDLDPKLTLALAAFVGVIVTAIGNIYTGAKSRGEQQRKEQTEFVHYAIQALVQLFAKYEAFIQDDASSNRSSLNHRATHAQIVGQAIAELLVVKNSKLHDIALNRLTPSMVGENDNPEEFAKYGDFKNRNRNAMVDALMELGEMQRRLIGMSDREK